MHDLPKHEAPSWKIRRGLVIATLVFCAAITVYLTGWAESDELRETIASGVLFLAGSVLMGYTFGVVWNDTSMFKSSRQMTYYDPYSYYPPEPQRVDNPERQSP